MKKTFWTAVMGIVTIIQPAQATIITTQLAGGQAISNPTTGTTQFIETLFTVDTQSGKIDLCYVIPTSPNKIVGCKVIGTFANPSSAIQMVNDGVGVSILNPTTGHVMSCSFQALVYATSLPSSVSATCTNVTNTLP